MSGRLGGWRAQQHLTARDLCVHLIRHRRRDQTMDVRNAKSNLLMMSAAGALVPCSMDGWMDGSSMTSGGDGIQQISHKLANRFNVTLAIDSVNANPPSIPPPPSISCKLFTSIKYQG